MIAPFRAKTEQRVLALSGIALLICVTVFVLIPIVVAVVLSFSGGRLLRFPITGWSLRRHFARHRLPCFALMLPLFLPGVVLGLGLAVGFGNTTLLGWPLFGTWLISFVLKINRLQIVAYVSVRISGGSSPTGELKRSGGSSCFIFLLVPTGSKSPRESFSGSISCWFKSRVFLGLPGST